MQQLQRSNMVMFRRRWFLALFAMALSIAVPAQAQIAKIPIPQPPLVGASSYIVLDARTGQWWPARNRTSAWLPRV